MCAINRREFLNRTTTSTLAMSLGAGSLTTPTAMEALPAEQTPAGAPPENAAGLLPGTTPLTMEGDLATQMVDGIHRFLLRRTEEAARSRPQLWNPDYSSVENYERSLASHRESLRHIIGAVDPRAGVQPPQLLATIDAPAQIARRPGYKVLAVRWRVFDPVILDFDGLEAEGLLLEPDGPPVARIVAIPDADWTPEMLAGMAPGIAPAAQFARRLAERGCQVVVPLIINRDDTFSGIPGVDMTNLPHREWIYRMAFEVGRHIIGYEVQKVLAAVDWFESENLKRRLPIGLIGYGEGGLLALHSAAIDARIDSTMVSGYFQGRDEVWKEPIYRDVWGLVREFGDAELAALVAPRALIVEASQGPEVAGPPPATAHRKNYACPNGKLVSPPLASVEKEIARSRPFFAGLKTDGKLQLIPSDGGRGLPGSTAALQAFTQSLGLGGQLRATPGLPASADKSYDPTPRLHRQFDQMVGFTQALVRTSADRREKFWHRADPTSPERWKDTARFYRDYVWDEVIGRLPPPNLPPSPRSRLIMDEPKFRAYEVMLDVWPDVFAYGILLQPKNIKPGERRPVMVCQHGLEDRPIYVVDPKIDHHYYHRLGSRLADEGFVVYAPQNPYIGEDHFRIIQRMGHPLKLALFSFILGQHEQMLNWLSAQPFVDPERIGFYGLSYGGKTAVRVPPLLERYALSICCADYNEWVWKTTNLQTTKSYLLSREYDMYEFNFANVVNYAELATLMAPRPFMVERGHNDIVGTDEWVSYEYAGVRRLYDQLGIGDRTTIEFFNGPHTIHGVGTFEFIHRHLRWPG